MLDSRETILLHLIFPTTLLPIQSQTYVFANIHRDFPLSYTVSMLVARFFTSPFLRKHWIHTCFPPLLYLDNCKARCQMGFILNQPISTILSLRINWARESYEGAVDVTSRINSTREAETPVFSIVLTAYRQLYLTSRVVWNVVATTLSIS